jgi:hypothetical protein
MRRTGILAAFVTTLLAATAHAEPVTVRFTEGVARGFPIIRATTGQKLAQGDMTQVARGDRVESRLVFRFSDGSLHEETVVFSQRDIFTLLSYRLVQRGPSFPETIEATLDRETGRYQVRYRADQDSEEEHHAGRFEMPEDAYNGMFSMLMKNLGPGETRVVHHVAFTPKPHAIKMLIYSTAEDAFFIGGDTPVRAARYQLRPQLGLFASLLVSDLPDLTCWIATGDAPAFLKFEGPLYFQGPVWRIEPN